MYAKTTQNSLHIQISSIACQDNQHQPECPFLKVVQKSTKVKLDHFRYRRSDWCWYLMTMHGKVNFFSLSGRCMPKLLKIVFTFKFHPLHAKISTPTGTPIPDKKVKELSSIKENYWTPPEQIILLTPPRSPLPESAIQTPHTKLRLNLAGMLSRLESVGTMSSLHQMVHLKPKIALAQKWHPWSSPFRPFCPVKVQIFARQIQM